MSQSSQQRLNFSVPRAALTFACLQGALAAVTQVVRSNLTWLVAQTQPTMSLRVVLQMISGLLAISLAPLAAATAKRLGGSRLVATLAFLVVPLSLGMSWVAAGGSMLVRNILIYGIGVAFIQTFSFSAHEEFLSSLVGQQNDRARNKAIVIKLRNAIQFIGRVVIWIALAIGALTVTGVAAAKNTYLLEAVFLIVFGVVVLTLRKKTNRQEREATPLDAPAGEPWQWNHPLLGVFVLEFSLNCFFLGALMLPRLLPDKSLSTLYYVMAIGGVGSILGTLFTRMTPRSLWGFILLDIITILFTYSQQSTMGIAFGWGLANMCYGATDTIFARAVQAGTSDRAANLASIRRLLMAGFLNFTLYGIVKAQGFFVLSERQICFVSIALTSLLVSFCWLKRKWINQALNVAVRT
ncbi:MAG TPA: hypothetical protein VI306_05820 [Pyrinomonadaceae bacterium]